MAQRLGMRALWAAYGSHRLPEHQTLVAAVAHWSGADVDDERTASLQCVTPDATLHTAGELLNVVTALPVAMHRADASRCPSRATHGRHDRCRAARSWPGRCAGAPCGQRYLRLQPASMGRTSVVSIYPIAPGAPGHEGWGRIERVGAHVRNVSQGDAVALQWMADRLLSSGQRLPAVERRC
jgi:Alcohol dehydrogenase GroES-like domain